MQHRKTLRGLPALLLASTLAGCGESQPGEEAPGVVRGDGKLTVYTVNYPLQYFAQRIGGDLVQVEFPAPPDIDPAYWEPDAETIAAYQGADLILLNGAHYARWVDRTTLPAAKLVNTAAAFEDRYIELEGVMTHSHGPEGEHTHGDVAFTTWLDLTLAVEHARAIGAAFAAARPRHAAAFQQSLDALERELMDLDAQLQNALTSASSTPLLASHPVYQYFGRRYALDIESVHFEPDAMPEEDAWLDLERLHAEHPARWMIWEAEPLGEIVTRLREMGIKPVVLCPCGNAPPAGDFVSVMEANVESLGQAFSG